MISGVSTNEPHWRIETGIQWYADWTNAADANGSCVPLIDEMNLIDMVDIFWASSLESILFDEAFRHDIGGGAN